jgi:hypothetical protein
MWRKTTWTHVTPGNCHQTCQEEGHPSTLEGILQDCFSRELNVSGSKARFVAQGCTQMVRVDVTGVFAPVEPEGQCCVRQLRKTEIRQVDIRTAFFMVNYKKRYLLQPPRFENGNPKDNL